MIYAQFVSCLKVKGFYRGLMFPLCCNGLLNSIVFGVYGNSFRHIQAMQVTVDFFSYDLELIKFDYF